MCGGAIISDFIPVTGTAGRTRRVTADCLWPDLRKPISGKRFSKPLRPEVAELEDDFEADFREFKDDSEIDEDDNDVDMLVDVKPFAFTPTAKPSKASKPLSRGKILFLFFFFGLNFGSLCAI